MALISPILRSVDGGMLMWHCPGCRRAHAIQTGQGPGPRWGWNSDAHRPTFTPSVLVRYEGPDAGSGGAPPAVCHSFVVDGAMQFLGDCTHALAGQTVPIPPWPSPLPAGEPQ